MKVEVRPMHPSDVARVAQLSGQLGYPATDTQMAQRFEAICRRRDQVVLVAVAGTGVVAGWLHLLTAGYLQYDPYAEIGGLVVDEAYRSQGIGEALVQAAEGWAAGQGMVQMRLRSNAIRHRAHRFYERLGYTVTKQSLQFSKNICIDNSRDNK